jgi:hypothetical protein
VSNYPPRLIDRDISQRARRQLVSGLFLVWALVLAGGGVVGYLLGSGSDRVGYTLFGVFAGTVIFFILTWTVLIFAGTRRDRRATPRNPT